MYCFWIQNEGKCKISDLCKVLQVLFLDTEKWEGALGNRDLYRGGRGVFGEGEVCWVRKR